MEKHGGFNVSWVEEQAHVALYPEWLSPGGGGSAATRINYGGPQRPTWSTLGPLRDT